MLLPEPPRHFYTFPTKEIPSVWRTKTKSLKRKHQKAVLVASNNMKGKKAEVLSDSLVLILLVSRRSILELVPTAGGWLDPLCGAELPGTLPSRQ